MKKKIKYSFVVIAYNEEKSIGTAIRSIVSQITLKNDYEILVINDASTDGTASVVKKLAMKNIAIKIINNESNMGRGYSRGKGVENAKGEYVAFVDADIILPKNWLKRCVEEGKDYDATGGIAVPDGDVSYVYSKFDLLPKVLNHTTAITGSNALFKKSALLSVGPNANMRDGEDVDLTWRFQQANLKVKSLTNLVCLHKEYKSFSSSLDWLYQQGAGANRLLARFGTIRLPDITFFAFLGVVILTLPGVMLYPVLLLAPAAFVLTVSGVHIYRKFAFEPIQLPVYVMATVVHSTMIAAYLMGRLTTISLMLEEKK